MTGSNSSGSSRTAVRQRLFLAFERSGLTQDELARRCGAAKGTVSDWFNAHKDAVPDGEKMARLPMALGVSGHWLLTGEGPTVAGGEGAIKRAERTGARSVLADLVRAIDQLRVIYTSDDPADATRAAKVAAHERAESQAASSMPGRRRSARPARRRAS